VRAVEGPNYSAIAGTFLITRHGAAVAVLRPEKRQYWVQRQVTSETAIKLNRGNNILLALGEDLGAGRWSLRIQIRPLVSLIWIAAFIMALGGALAASDRRYRTARAREAAPQALPAGEAG
jgi:cytochrome c-type biogenesis protein CcmF